jgi:hypothetical protein
MRWRIIRGVFVGNLVNWTDYVSVRFAIVAPTVDALDELIRDRILTSQAARFGAIIFSPAPKPVDFQNALRRPGATRTSPSRLAIT